MIFWKVKIIISLQPPNCEYLPLPNEDGGYTIPVVDQRPNTYPTTLIPVESNDTESITTLSPTSYPYSTETMEPSDQITDVISSTYTGETTLQVTTETTTQPPVSLTNEDSYGAPHMPGSIPPGDVSANVDAGYSGGNYANGGNKFAFSL